MSPISERHFIPCVHPSTSKTVKIGDKSHTQTLSLNLSQICPLLILFSHLTQSLSCTLGNLLINPLRGILFFIPVLSSSRLCKNVARTIFRIISPQLLLFNFSEETEMKHTYECVPVRCFIISIFAIQTVRQKTELSLLEELHTKLYKWSKWEKSFLSSVG